MLNTVIRKRLLNRMNDKISCRILQGDSSSGLARVFSFRNKFVQILQIIGIFKYTTFL